MDSRRLPSVVFVLALVMGVLAKVWRAGDLFLEAGALDGFRWLPIGLGSELVVAGVFAGLVALAGRVNLWAGGVVFGGLVGGEQFWLCLNDVSFRVSQIGVTWERLRGDEGVPVKDFHLMAFGDVIPALVYAFVAIVLCAGAAWLLRTRSIASRAIVIATALGGCIYLADLFVFSARNFGMGDSPVLLIARTYVRAFFGREFVEIPRAVPVPKTKEERLALLKAQEPAPPNAVVPERKVPAVKNGILFFSEGIARKQTGLEGQQTTPNLMQALQEEGGLDLTNYYTTYHKSIAAIFSMTCSDFPPPNAKNIMEVNPRIDCGALPEVLSKNGVHAGLFHGGDFGFYDKLQLLGMRGFEIQKDARAIVQPGIWEYDWGVDDRATVDSVLAWIDSLPKGERFFAVVIPITAHYPYAIPTDVQPAFPGNAAKDRFYSAVHFLDDAFGRLNDGLKKRGLADDTALLFMADHGETVAERPRAQAGRRLAYEPSVHIPFVILAPSMFPTWQKNGRIGSHVDLLPTILDLMGLPQDERNHGQSLLSTTYEPRRVFVGASNGPRYVGWVDGRQKFVVNRNSGLMELYNLDKDPFEQDNLAPAQPEKAQRLADEALAFADGQLQHLLKAPRIAGDIDVQIGLLENADVTMVKADGTRVACPKDPAATGTGIDLLNMAKLPFRRVCPGVTKQPFLGQRNFRAGATRTCVLVNVPEGGGSLEIHLGHEPWLPFLTRIRSAIQRSTLDRSDDATITAFGDGKQGQEKTISRGAPNVRTTFPSSQDNLVVRVSGDHPLASPVCLTFTEKAWRGRGTTGAPATSVQAGEPPPDVDGTEPLDPGDDGVHDDDVHGKQPEN
jgi:hypothetical protein